MEVGIVQMEVTKRIVMVGNGNILTLIFIRFALRFILYVIEYAPIVKNGSSVVVFSSNSANNELICEVSIEAANSTLVTTVMWANKGNVNDKA